MEPFDALTLALEGWFDHRLCELPGILRERVEQEFFSMPWTWQYLARKHGVDLTRSTLAARHDGGEQDGEFYDSDFGGPMYVDGAEGLELPDLSPADHRTAKAKAVEIFDGTP